jgi:hypothetical protein
MEELFHGNGLFLYFKGPVQGKEFRHIKAQVITVIPQETQEVGLPGEFGKILLLQGLYIPAGNVGLPAYLVVGISLSFAGVPQFISQGFHRIPPRTC